MNELMFNDTPARKTDRLLGVRKRDRMGISTVCPYHWKQRCISNGKVIKDEVTELVSNHEEADTLICMHVNHINSTKVQNIIIRASDTDIAVILIYHRRKFDANRWMDIGTSFRNDKRYVNITAIK